MSKKSDYMSGYKILIAGLFLIVIGQFLKTLSPFLGSLFDLGGFMICLLSIPSFMGNKS